MWASLTSHLVHRLVIGQGFHVGAGEAVGSVGALLVIVQLAQLIVAFELLLASLSSILIRLYHWKHHVRLETLKRSVVLGRCRLSSKSFPITIVVEHE
jgi:hypothetical protein